MDHQLRKGTGQTRRTVIELEDKIRQLNDTINSDRKEAEEIFNDLKTENRNLKLQIRDILRCEECDEIYNSKVQMKEHIQTNHQVTENKRDLCEASFPKKDDLNTHMMKKHPDEKLKNDLSKKFHALSIKVSKQKSKIYEDLLTLKKREEHANRKCRCKSRYCRINHFRHGWKMSKCDDFQTQIRSLSSDNSVIKDVGKGKEESAQDHPKETQSENTGLQFYKCKPSSATFQDDSYLIGHNKTDHVKNFECKACDNKISQVENMSIHMENKHVSDIEFKQCDDILANKEELNDHMQRYHDGSLTKNISTQSSILKSFENCSEDEILSHEDEHETQSPLEITFFNPSVAKSKFHCQPCAQQFSDEVNMMNHIDIKHS